MAKVALDQLVRTKSGEVTTIARLADRGLITFREVQHFKGSARGSIRKAYFADMPDGCGWEISKLAYLSRTGQAVSV